MTTTEKRKQDQNLGTLIIRATSLKLKVDHGIKDMNESGTKLILEM